MNLLNRLKELNEIKKLNSNVIIRVICVDGDIIEGKYLSYTSKLNNEPEEAELEIRSLKTGGYIGIFEHEIESIELTD